MTPSRPSAARTGRRAVIAGGGIGGLEAALALRALAGDRVGVTVVEPEPWLVYRPLSVGVPFGGASLVRVELAAIAAQQGFELVIDRVNAVAAHERAVLTENGGRLAYDDLVLALGARPMAAVPGALTFRGPADVEQMRAELARLEEAGGGRVVFVARTATAWTIALYELALLTSTWAAERGVELQILIVTPETTPLEVLGEDTGREVAELLDQRGIIFHGRSVADAVVEGALRIPVEGQIEADLVVALPVLVGPELDGVDRDELGFVPVDELCRVPGAPGVYAVGDMTSREVKQGGLAAQQADVAAAAIAAAAGAPVRPEPYAPVLRALLFTGDAPLYLRHPRTTAPEGLAESGRAAPWWPPHKIVGAHLAPYLATHADLLEADRE